MFELTTYWFPVGVLTTTPQSQLRVGQDLFDFSDLTWAHQLTYQSTHSILFKDSLPLNTSELI